jgi:hypothetical protein
MPISTA